MNKRKKPLVKERFLVLDSLRGLASLFVVLYHYTVRYEELYCGECKPFIEVTYGGYGVELFFILSGFVIFFSVRNNGSLRLFIYSRFFRLYPAYWGAIFVTSFFIFYFGLEGREISLNQFFVNITMLQEYFRVENIDGVYWTLAIELAFYIAIGVILFLKHLSKISIYINLWLVVYVLLKMLLIFERIPPLPSYLLILFDYSLLFCLGVFFNKYYYSKDKIYYSHILIISFIYLLLASHNALISLVIIIIYALFVFGKLNFLIAKPFLFLGSISYPLYLIHQNIGYILLNTIPFEDINIKILVALIIIIAISYAIHILLEVPFMKISKNLRKKLTSE